MCSYGKMLMTASKVSWVKWPSEPHFNRVIVHLPAHRHDETVVAIQVYFAFSFEPG